MKKSLTAKVLSAAMFAVSTSAMLFAPAQASAKNGFSLGHGVTCSYVLVSYDPATGTSVYATVCSKGV